MKAGLTKLAGSNIRQLSEGSHFVTYYEIGFPCTLAKILSSEYYSANGGKIA